MKIKITGGFLAASAWDWGWGISRKIRRKKKEKRLWTGYRSSTQWFFIIPGSINWKNQFLRRRKIDAPGHKPLRAEAKSNNNGAVSGIRTQAALVTIECTQHCTDLAPSSQTATSFPQRGFTEVYLSFKEVVGQVGLLGRFFCTLLRQDESVLLYKPKSINSPIFMFSLS